MRQFLRPYLFCYKPILLAILLISCGHRKNIYQSFPQLINGSWKVVNTPVYTITGIEFDETGGTFYNTGDTLLRYSFVIKKDILTLRDKNNETTPNKIIKLTKDSLIFKTLLWDSTKQSFIRVKSLWEK